MKRRISFGSLSMESFDSSPTGNVTALAQPLTPEQPLVTSGYTESPFSGSENYAAEAAKRIDPKKILSAPALESASEHEAQQLYAMLFKAHDCHSEADIHETFGLQPGASDAQLQKVAGHFHGKLPDLLVALLKIHNGQPAWWHSSQGQAGWSEDIYPHVCTMFGCDDMIHMSEDFMRAMGDMDEWYGPIDTDPRVKPVQWSRHWLPLASNEDHKRATTYVLDFDPGPGGKQGQVVKIEQLGNKRIVLGDNFNTWFPGLIKRHASYMSLEARTTPRYPLRKPAMEGDVVIADEDEFDALIRNANGITSLMDDSTSVSLEAKDSNKLALAKNKMHGRFKKMFEGWTDGWRTAPGLINKYRKRLEELKTELSGVIVHGPLDVNLSGLWQHFSNEAGPIHNNLVGKVHEDLQFSHYILADYSAKAFEQLTHLEKALHTGQGNSDEEAKRTALDIEKCEAPSMYLDHKWMCKAGEQPYLSVTGIGVHQGRAPRPVAISGISMDRLALMAMPFSVREYGSFLHGMKKLVVNSSKSTTRLTESDLEKILSMGVEYLDGAQSYMAAYHGCWPVFRRIDESLEMIWNDFDLTDWSVNFGDEEDGDAYEVSWQTSGTGDIRRRAALYDQILGVVQNFSDAVVAPGSHEMHRAIRAAKFHCYLLEAALKVAKDQAMQKTATEAIAQELFGFGKKEPAAPVTVPSIKESLEALMKFSQSRGLGIKFRPAAPQKIAAVEKAIGMKFPAELHQLYSLVNGQEDGNGWINGDTLLALEEIAARYSRQEMGPNEHGHEEGNKYDSDKGKVDPSFRYHPKWIPFTDAGDGDVFVVDMAPGPQGKSGQVLRWAHDDNGRLVYAPDLKAFIAREVKQYIEWYTKKYGNKEGSQDHKPAGM